MKTLSFVVPVAKSRKHRVLYDRDLPFRGRREEPKTVFRRKPKHPKRDEVI